MGISIGMVGLGSFASCFVDLFKSHPLVDRIAFCDREPDRVQKWADSTFMANKFNPKDRYYLRTAPKASPRLCKVLIRCLMQRL